MRSFDITERDFKIETHHGRREKLYLVHLPKTMPKQLAGFIRFSYDAKELGTLEMANFKAALQRRHLGIGGIFKAEDKKQMGQHGEELKLSALVNRRHPHNYSFVAISSGCRWVFGWNVEKKLNCRIQLPSGSKSGAEFRYGYNLLEAATGRDRDTIASSHTEAQKISQIWGRSYT